jgi:Ulp1 family protease
MPAHPPDHVFFSLLCSDHWVLIVIVPKWNKVFYLDSMIRPPGYPDRDFTLIKGAIDEACVIFKARGGATQFKKGHQKLSHSFKVPCKQQPQGSVTCGFYVCAHMDELVRQDNPHWEEQDFMKVFVGENYDWRKDFARIRETFAHFFNHDVLHHTGEFYTPDEGPPAPV